MSSNLDDFLRSTDDGLFLIGHASALVRTSQYLTLFDPIWGDAKPYGDSWVFWPKQIDCESIVEEVDRVVISHEHADHLYEPILRRVKCPVHIMSGRPRLRARIESCGARVVEHQPRSWRWFTPNSDIFFLEHPFNGVDSLPVIRGKNITVSLGSDCFLDVAGVDVLRRACPPIDVALVPHAFIHWWPFLQSDIEDGKKHVLIQREVVKCQGQADLFRSALSPKVAFATGDSLFFADGSKSIMNRHLISPELPSGLLPNRPGSYVLMDKGGIKMVLAAASDPFPEKRLPELKIWPAKLDERRRLILKTKLAKADPFHKEFDIVVNDLPIAADELTFGSIRGHGQPYYHFRFDISILNQWLDGKLTLEQAIGTRRFEFRRRPVDHYDPKMFDWMNRWL